MESFSHPPHDGMQGRLFPVLPIVTPDPPRLSQREKYGSLFYLGLLGLAVVIALVAWFLHGAWELRDVWSNIYVLHDESRPAKDRVRAAFALSRDPRLNQRQRWDICLRRPLPAPARYAIAESLTAEAASADPRGYALAVARSPDWPSWLRLLLTRPMAYAAVAGVRYPRAPLVELKAIPDRGVQLWAAFIMAEQDEDDHAGLQELEAACRGSGWDRELGCLLLESVKRRGQPAEQRRILDRATSWLRTHEPDCRAVWSGAN